MLEVPYAVTYNRLGRQKTITDYIGLRTLSYNSDNLQLDTETITGFYNKTITRTYETTGVPGRNTGFTLGTDYSVNYGYDSNTGRFQSINWNVNNVTGSVNYSYRPSSDLLNGYTTPNGFQVNYGYESNRNLRTQVQNKYNNQVISEYTYVYDALGRKTSMQTTGTAPWGTPNLQVENKAYTTNNLNQYNEITENPGSVTTNLSYDLDGNLTQINEGTNGSNYFYDGENRLIRVEPQTVASGTTKVECFYDYMGRRINKKVFNYNAGSWILASDSFFAYDGFNMIHEQTTVTGHPFSVKSYLYGLDLSQSIQGAGGIGGLIASIDTSTAKMYYYFYDANGNVGQLIDSADGSLTAHYEYDPYGNITVKTGPNADQNPYRFSSKYFDQETCLGYWTYRYYSPSLGRWINRDPLEEEGGINLYEFVRNDPVNWIDIFGFEPENSGYIYHIGPGAYERESEAFNIRQNLPRHIYVPNQFYFRDLRPMSKTVLPPDLDIIQKLRCIANKLGVVLTISSGYRYPVSGSEHERGRAADIIPPRSDYRSLCQFKQIASSCGFTRVCYSLAHGHIHVDTGAGTPDCQNWGNNHSQGAPYRDPCDIPKCLEKVLN